MNRLISSFLGSALLCTGFGFHITNYHPEVVKPLSEWFMTRDIFTFLFFAVILVTGIIFIGYRRRGSRLHNWFSMLGDTIANFYASAAGATCGWSGGVLSAIAIENPKQYLIISIIFAISIFAFFIAPLKMFSVAKNDTEQVNNEVFIERNEGPFIRTMGFLLVVDAVFGVFYKITT